MTIGTPKEILNEQFRDSGTEAIAARLACRTCGTKLPSAIRYATVPTKNLPEEERDKNLGNLVASEGLGHYLDAMCKADVYVEELEITRNGQPVSVDEKELESLKAVRWPIRGTIR